MRTMIFGTGAVGIYYGARLAAAWQSVVFVARVDEDRDALRAHGARVDGASGTIAGAVEAVVEPSQAGPCDVVLVTVKALATQGAAYLLRPVVRAETIVLPLQAGIGSDAVLDATLGGPPVVRGVTDLVADLVEPGVVRHHRGGEIVFGELDGRRGTGAEPLAALLSTSGIAHRRSGAIVIETWMKLAWDAAFNGIGAVSGCPFGAMVAQPRWRRFLTAAMREVVAVAQASGIAVDDGFIAASLEDARELADVQPPMLQDRIRGWPLDSDALFGAVVRAAARVGVQVPINTMLQRALHEPSFVTRYTNPGRSVGN